jgi:hypothetical protein
MPVEGDFEDPRQWSDMGFGSEDEAPDPEAMRQMMEGQDGDWEKQDLGKLGRLMAKGSNPGKKVGQNRDADASDDTDEPNETKTAEQDAGGSAVLVAVLVIAVLGIVAFGVVWLLGVSV